MSNNLRFTVGDTYVFMRVLFEQKTPRFGRLYFPWEDTLQAIEVVNLTCVEHHKVAWDQDPASEKKYDGFVFKDTDGNVWHNQYPSASYGQLDDTSDRLVYRHFETNELLLVDEHGEALKDGKGDMIRVPGAEAREKWEIFDSQFWHPFELATQALGSMHRVIHPLARDKACLEDTEKQSLKDHMLAVITKVEDVSGKKIIFAPLVFKFTDGRPDKVTDFMRAKLVHLDFPEKSYRETQAPAEG